MRSLSARIFVVVSMAACAWALPAGALVAPRTQQAGAASLRATYEQLLPQLQRNDFGRPIHLDSAEAGHDLAGDIHALLDHPFARVDEALHQPADWCEILILPHNTKQCVVNDGGRSITIWVGRKNTTPVDDCYRLDFNWQLVSRSKDYLQVVLTSASGPLGTRDYRIQLEATPVEGRTLLHLSYHYAYGTVSRLAMQAYLATVGASKVGFTVEGRERDGTPQYVRGMRGVMERNTMRYFFAIDAYLNSLSAPPQSRLQKRLDDWFSANERYPRQLRESDRGEYVAMKQRDYQRVRNAG